MGANDDQCGVIKMESIIIGNGTGGNSAILLCHYTTIGNRPRSNYISHNKTHFWANNVLGNVRLVIEKTCSAGVKLGKLIEAQQSLGYSEAYAVSKYLLKLVFTHVDAELVMMHIDAIYDEAYDAGMDDKAQQFRAVLGI